MAKKNETEIWCAKYTTNPEMTEEKLASVASMTGSVWGIKVGLRTTEITFSDLHSAGALLANFPKKFISMTRIA